MKLNILRVANGELRVAKQTNKRGSADLLVEIIVSSIIFFIIVFLLFSVKLPGLQFNAAVTAISVDATMVCEISLSNLLRAPSSKSLTYSDWLISSYEKGKLDEWTAEVNDTFNYVFSEGNWSLSLTLPNGTELKSIGKIANSAGIDIFSCTTYVPFAASETFHACFPEIKPATVSEQNTKADFTTPDGPANCTVILDEDYIGFVEGETTCILDLAAKNVLEEDLPNKLKNYAGELDTLTLPILVNATVPYKITIEETRDASPKEAIVYLNKTSDLPNCSINLTLQTTNISVSDSVKSYFQ